MISIVFSIVSTACQIVYYGFIFILRAILGIFNVTVPYIEEKVGNSRWNKKMKNSKESVLAAQSELYGETEGLNDFKSSFANTVIVSKTIKPLLDNSEVAVKLSGDDTACEIAQDVLVRYITFELGDKTRCSFAIKDSNIYDLLFEGDVGTLVCQGKKFIDFIR